MEIGLRKGRDVFKTLTRATLVLAAFGLPLSTTVTNILFPLAFLLSLFAETPAEKWRFLTRNIIAILLVVLFFYYVISLSYTEASFSEVMWRMKKVWLLLFAAMLMSFFEENRYRDYAINAFLAAMVITLLLSYIKFYFNPNIMSNRFPTDSVFKDHIIQNFLMALTAFVFAYRCLKSHRFRCLYGSLFLLSSYNIFFINAGRVGYFVFALLLIYFAFAQYGWKGFFSSVVLAVLLFVSAFSLSSVFRNGLLHLEDNYRNYQQGHAATSLGIRMTSWQNAVYLIKQRPVLGHGVGSFKTAYATLSRERTEATGIMAASYNAYLNIAVELGVVGVLLFLILLLVQWSASFALEPGLRFVIQAFLLSYMLGSLANPWLSDTTEWHLYCLLSAIAFGGVKTRWRPFFGRKGVLSSDQ